MAPPDDMPPENPTTADLAAREAAMQALSSSPNQMQMQEEFIPGSKATRLRQLAAEMAVRRMDALELYEGLPSQIPFHQSETRTRVVRGSNRAGKTLCAAVEVARAVQGRDPSDKYPKEDGRWFCVGKDLKHIGKVMWRKLSRAGAFKMIRDLKTKKWRAFRPWNKGDAAREAEAKPAPPLIPPRMIKSIAWENKKEGCPSTVTLTNGWEISFYSSLGKPPQGSDIDGAWFDEEIVDPDWFPEMSARCLDRHGKMLWSATPQAGTDQLYELSERAADEKGKQKRTVDEFVVLLSDNPHIREEDKQALAADLSEEEARVRIGGEFAITSFKIYPQFSMLIHGIDYFPVPLGWTRYMVVDPGHQVCACLFAAVPPLEGDSHCGDFIYLYDELYLRDCDAVKFAEGVFHKTVGQQFETFIIDPHMAIHTELGTGKTVAQQYSDALTAKRVLSHTTGAGFKHASDDVKAGILAVHGWLRVGSSGSPKLRVLRGMLPNFEYEIKRYHKKRVRGHIVNMPDQKRANHLMDCFDSKTEALTARGWIPFSDAVLSDQFATVDLATNKIEYEQPLELIAKPFSGEMIAFGGHKLDGLVTPGHRMVVYPKYTEGPVVKEASQLSIWDRLKLHAEWSGSPIEKILVPAARGSLEKEIDPGDMAELLGWYVAEGCVATKIQMPGHGYAVMISQKCLPKRCLLESLLRRTPWNWNCNSSGFYASSKQLWEYLSPLGNAYNKRAPEWIKMATPDVIRRFLLGAVLGDGWVQNDRRSYVSVSKQLADDIQELFIKIGVTASLRVRKAYPYCINGRSGINTVDQFWVNEWTTPHGVLRNSVNVPNFGPTKYEGMVYCASVPNGTLVVRRNGKPMIAGNCLRYITLESPRFVPPRQMKPPLSATIKAFRAKQDRKAKASGGSFVNLGPRSAYAGNV